MTSAQPVPRRSPRLTVEEYLTFEALSDVRHEFVGGHVHAMSGGSIRHSTLAQVINSHLFAAFSPQGCRVHTHDTKLRVSNDRFYYPDVFVTCGPIEHPLYEVDARWVVEVRSDSTGSTDEREKAIAYLRLPSILGYVLADPEGRYIEVRTPAEVGWDITVYRDGDVVQLPPAELSVRDVFDTLDRLAPH